MNFCEYNNFLCKNYDKKFKTCRDCEFYANKATDFENGSYCYFDSWNYPFIIIAIFVLLMFLVSAIILLTYAVYNIIGKLSQMVYNVKIKETSKTDSEENPSTSFDVEMIQENPESF